MKILINYYSYSRIINYYIMKLKNLYKFELGKSIYNRAISLGKFDGENFSITYATLGGKVIIYCPNDKKSLKQQNQSKETVLNINKEIVTLTYGAGQFGSNKNYLFVASPSSLYCYDFLENRTIFNKEIDDGVFSMVFGAYSNFQKPLIIVGGNCSLQGFDITGEEMFWTVTGGNTLSISLNDVDDDSYYEAIVGTDDFNISYIKKEQSIHQIPENNKVVLLYSYSNFILYGLETGTIGLYKKGTRLWYVKDNGIPTSGLMADINRDNINELIVGFSTGEVKILSEMTGEILLVFEFKIEVCKLFWENLSDNKTNLTSSKYNSDSNQLIIFLSNGEVMGYDYDEIEKFEKIDGYKEECAKLQRLQNEKQSITTQLQKLAVEIANMKKFNVSREINNLTEQLQVNIDLKSNNEQVSSNIN